MSMVPHHSSQTIPGDMRSPTHTSQPRGWRLFNRDALTCFMTKMPVPKRQPGPPQPCSSKFTERLEEHPRGQRCRARQVPRQGCPADACGKDSICYFISSNGSKREVPDSKPELTLCIILSRNSCMLGWASCYQEQPQSVNETPHRGDHKLLSPPA